MARIPMVTRTITTTKAIVMCVNIADGETFTKEVILPRTYKDNKSLMKQITKLVDNDTVKAVHVVDKTEVETLYGMTEQEFISYAKELPPRTKAELEEEN